MYMATVNIVSVKYIIYKVALLSKSDTLVRSCNTYEENFLPSCTGRQQTYQPDCMWISVLTIVVNPSKAKTELKKTKHA